MNKVVVIGAGFGGLSTACYLAQAGYDVTIIEKNSQHGGRAMTLAKDGFLFDLGPSWYMMPDVFEDYFADFGKKPSDYYELVKLDPSYKVFNGTRSYDVYDAPRVYELFEQLEKGSSEQLKTLLGKTKTEYEQIRKDLLSSPMISLGDVANMTAARLLANPELLGSYHSRIKKYIKNTDLQKILEFMVVFMGGSPKNIPALYSLLAYVDMGLGIWYPMGGMHRLAQAMKDLAESLGVKLILSEPVKKIIVQDSRAVGVQLKNEQLLCDVVVANADYHHVETELLQKANSIQWNKKVLSPSALLVYLGINKKLKTIAHHNLFFDVDWDGHFSEVFDTKKWSSDPMLYIGAPSVTDPSVAPKDHENLFILAPMANGDQPSQVTIDKTVAKIIKRVEVILGEDITNHIVVKEVRAHNYFKDSFNAYRGNAFGLAHTLKQSAILRPPIKNPRIKSLYYVGQYTNPGTGVPIVTIGGKVVAKKIIADWQSQ